VEDLYLKKANKETTRALYQLFFTATFFILCITIIFEVILAGIQVRTPKFFGYSISYVPTESMEPTIHADDYVLFHEANFDNVGVGDIIIYRSNSGRFIIHRIIEKTNDYIICQGDNNPIPDSENIYPDMIRGKYIKTIKALDIFSGGINRNLVYVGLIILFFLLIITQVASLIIKSKTDALKKKTEQNNKEKELLLKELRNQILAEELEKLRNKKKENEKGE